MVALSQWDSFSSPFNAAQSLVATSQASAGLCALGFFACCVK